MEDERNTRLAANPQNLRKATGCFATGVTIVAVHANGNIYGLTANSFVSISLSPALVLVSIAKEAKFHKFLQRGNKLGICVLSEKQEAISNHFAGKPMTPAPSFLLDSHAAPLLAHSHASFSASIQTVFDAGDHSLLLAAVKEVSYDHSLLPLLYYQGKYLAFKEVEAI